MRFGRLKMTKGQATVALIVTASWITEWVISGIVMALELFGVALGVAVLVTTATRASAAAKAKTKVWQQQRPGESEPVGPETRSGD